MVENPVSGQTELNSYSSTVWKMIKIKWMNTLRTWWVVLTGQGCGGALEKKVGTHWCRVIELTQKAPGEQRYQCQRCCSSFLGVFARLTFNNVFPWQSSLCLCSDGTNTNQWWATLSVCLCIWVCCIFILFSHQFPFGSSKIKIKNICTNCHVTSNTVYMNRQFEWAYEPFYPAVTSQKWALSSL